MTDSEQIKVTDRSTLVRRVVIYAIILLSVFLLGLIPMWLKARQRGIELETVRLDLRRSQMRGALSAAATDARRGDYEPARQTMSNFFSALSMEVERGKDSALDQTQRDALRPMLAQRDEVITLLARSDPAAADRIADLYASYRKVMGNAPPVTTPH
jgi:predicted exporter